MSESKLFLQLTGRNQQHLETWRDECLLHSDVLGPLQVLCERGAKAGFDIRVASGFRSYERQLAIWNGKARGERAVMDGEGKALDINELDDRQKVFSILRWSALPGGSRHHWGTDIDVWDAGAVPADYRLQLLSDEYQRGGPFFGLNQWLEGETQERHTGFFRPYGSDGESGDGVAPEPWHLSYEPVAKAYEAILDSATLKEFVRASDIELKTAVLAEWDTIYTRFIEPCGSA